jgi:hypothetical protein
MLMQNTPRDTTLHVEVVRAFTVKGERQEIGDVLKLEKHDALALVSMGKVKQVAAPEAEPEPEPEPAAKPKKG